MMVVVGGAFVGRKCLQQPEQSLLANLGNVMQRALHGNVICTDTRIPKTRLFVPFRLFAHSTSTAHRRWDAGAYRAAAASRRRCTLTRFWCGNAVVVHVACTS